MLLFNCKPVILLVGDKFDEVWRLLLLLHRLLAPVLIALWLLAAKGLSLRLLVLANLNAILQL